MWGGGQEEEGGGGCNYNMYHDQFKLRKSIQFSRQSVFMPQSSTDTVGWFCPDGISALVNSSIPLRIFSASISGGRRIDSRRQTHKGMNATGVALTKPLLVTRRTLRQRLVVSRVTILRSRPCLTAQHMFSNSRGLADTIISPIPALAPGFVFVQQDERVSDLGVSLSRLYARLRG